MNLIIEALMWILGLTEKNANVYTVIVTIIGVIVAWLAIRANRKSQRASHELLHQPSFQITDFATGEQIGAKRYRGGSKDIGQNNGELSKPKLCGNPDCHETHWLNIVNKDGCFAATDVKTGLFFVDDAGKVIYSDKNWTTRKYLASGDSIQYSLPIDGVPFDRHFDHERKKQYRFVLLLEYKSEFSQQIYKRVYYIYGASQDETRQGAESWTDAIYFFGTQEYCKTSRKTASKKARLIAFCHRYLKLDFMIDDWLNDFSRRGKNYEK